MGPPREGLQQAFGHALDTQAVLSVPWNGGCVVVLCDADSMSSVMEGLDVRYYSSRGETGLGAAIFEARASDGARVIRASPES